MNDRFYIDHGWIHDRVTGKHVITNGDVPEESRQLTGDDHTQQTCDLLNSLSLPQPIALSEDEAVRILFGTYKEWYYATGNVQESITEAYNELLKHAHITKRQHMKDKDREAFERWHDDEYGTSHNPIEGVDVVKHMAIGLAAYQAARAESAKEIAWLKDVIRTSVRNEQIEHLQWVVDAAKNLLEDSEAIFDFGDNERPKSVRQMREALAATQNTKEVE